MNNNELINIYYDLYDVLEDIEVVVDAIKEFTDCKLTKSYIKQNLEFLRLWNLEKELNLLYDMRVDDLKMFKSKCIKLGFQTTFEDLY